MEYPLNTTFLLPLAVLSIVSSLSTAVFADDSSIEEVVVTGQVLFRDQLNALKTPTPIIDVPQSVVVISSEQIESRAYTSITDIVNYVPGLNSSQGEGHRDSVVFRGVRSTADFFVDGVRDDVQYYRPLYNVEQVEVLKGPNALLFGRGGTGGVLNRVTKKGVLGEAFTQIGASIDTFGGAAVQVDRNVDVSETAALRVNASYESLENHRDFFDGDRWGVNPTLKLKLSEATTVDLSYEYLDHQRFIDRGIPTGADGRPVEAFEDIVFGDPQLNTTTLEAHLLKAMMQHRFSDDIKGNFSAFYGDYDKLYQNFYASGYDQAATPDQVTLDGYLDTTQRENLVLSGNVVAQIDAGSLRHTLLFGAEFIDTSSNQDRFNAFWDTTSDDNEVFAANRPLALSGGIGVNASGDATRNDFTSQLNDDTHVDVEATSVYVQDEVTLSESVKLVLGARYDEFDISVVNVKNAGEKRSRKDSEVSPRAGVIYKPQENVSIYASYSESFLPRSGEQFANISGDKNKLDPDTYSNLELGLKWDISGRLNMSAAIFEIESSSPQVADSDPSTLDVIDSTIEGFEAQVNGQLTDDWGVAVGYSYLDGDVVDRFGSTGRRLRELPENTFSIWSSYQATPRIGLGLGLTYQDDSFINQSNTATLPSYTRVDAAVYFDVSERLSLQLNIDNLADELYFPNAHSTHQATVGESINARLSMQWRP